MYRETGDRNGESEALNDLELDRVARRTANKHKR